MSSTEGFRHFLCLTVGYTLRFARRTRALANSPSGLVGTLTVRTWTVRLPLLLPAPDVTRACRFTTASGNVQWINYYLTFHLHNTDAYTKCALKVIHLNLQRFIEYVLHSPGRSQPFMVTLGFANSRASNFQSLLEQVRFAAP